MSSELHVVHECPGCGEPVDDDEDYVLAQEYASAPGFGQSDFEAHALASGAVRRFHVGHFRGQIGDRVYRLVNDSR